MKIHKNFFFIFLLFFVSIFFLSCASMGTKELSQHNIDKIIENKSTYKDVVKIFGYPQSVLEGRQMFIFNEKELKNYLYGYTLEKYDFPEGEYEVWRYLYIYSGAFSKDRRKDLIIVFNKKGIVIKILFSDVSKSSGRIHHVPVQPDFK